MPNVVGRALAQRLRIQAERLVSEIEGASQVDPAVPASAIALLERARAEQRVRRARKLVPPAPPTEEELAARAEAERAAMKAEAERRRLAAAPLPSPHVPPRPGAPPPYRWTWNRREAALLGWKRRYARMRDAGLRFKTDTGGAGAVQPDAARERRRAARARMLNKVLISLV